MNNLIVLAGREFGLEHALDGAEVTSAALDTANSLLFCTTDDDRLLGISLKGGDPMHEAPVEDVQNIAVLPEVEGVLLVDKHGALSVYHLDSCSFERVGDMAGGLLSTSSSPDGEIVLCLTASYTLIALNMQWGIVFEKQLEQLKIEGVARASVSWSADGMKFVLLLQTEDLSSSYVLVLDRQGNIEAESEVMQDMDDCVAFKTDGSLIAACQRRSGGKQIIFFEPNALRHYEFSLLKEDGQRRVESLCWNSDGSLLAVALRGEEGGGCGKVQLWHRSNYHWYLKQEFLPCTKSSTCCRPWMLWSDDDPNVVVVGFDHQDSNVYTLDWRFDLSPSDSMMLSGSADTSAIDLKTIAMIDGKKLLLTPLGKMLVPPPMAAVTVELPVPISSVCWSPAGDVAVLCSDGSLQILGRPFEGGDSSRWSKVPAVEVEVAGDRTRRIVQLLWLKGRVLLAICCQSSALVPVLLKGGEGESWRMEVGAKIDTSAPVSRLLREEGRNACLVQLEDGQVLEAECAGEQEKITMKSIGKMATTCNKLMIPRGGGKLIIGINKRGKLLVNEEPLAESVTSCCLHDKHLIYTTASCDLVFVPLSFFSSSSSVKSSSSMSMAATNDQRLLERGAQLVTAPLNDQKVVLLLPRGNLEILHPQSLVVHHCCSLLSCSKYLDVLLTMRKHKIDMNLLHDYDPRSFAENVEKIVKEVNSSHLLSLFIAALKEEDVTETMYKYVKDFVPMKQTQQRGEANMSKVNFVCKLVRDAMEECHETSFLSSIVLTFVRQNPPKVAEALRHLQDAGASIRSEGLEVLMGLVDPSTVFDESLGLYDLDLAAAAAEQGGRDPREYLPLLERLSALPDRLCCFEIDMMLKRRDSAMKHIILAGGEHWERARELMLEHALYEIALRVLKTQDRQKHLNEAYDLYASHLLDSGRYRDAALAFRAADNLSSSLNALQQGGLWQPFFLLLHETGAQPNEIQRRAYELAEGLRVTGQGKEAARLFLDYCQDTDEAVSSLTEVGEWLEAARVARSKSRADLIQTSVLPSLKEAHASMKEDLKQKAERLLYIISRLQTIQREKEEKEAKEHENEEDVDDAASERSAASSRSQASSRSSRSTRSTKSSKSSKSTKSRSSARVPKEGDPWEEEYLLNARLALLPTERTKESNRSLAESLIFFGQLDRARDVQDELSRLIKIVEDNNLDHLTPPPIPPQKSDWKISIL